MNYLVTAMLVFLVAMEYPNLRSYLNRSLSSIDADTARAVRDSLRPPLRRFLWAWVTAILSCGAIVIVPLLLGGNSHIIRTFAILAIYGSLWAFQSPVLKQLEREREERGIPRTPWLLQASRSASLTPRTVTSYLPPVMLVLPWAIVVLSTAYLAVKASQNPPTESWMWMLAIGGILGACFAIILGMQIISKIVSEPHPAGSSVSRMRELELMRSLQVYGAYIFMLLIVAMSLQSGRIGVESASDEIPYASFGEHGVNAARLGMAAAFIGVAFPIIFLVHAVRVRRKP